MGTLCGSKNVDKRLLELLCVGCGTRLVTTDDEGRPYNTGDWYEVTVLRNGINGSIEITGISSLGIVVLPQFRIA